MAADTQRALRRVVRSFVDLYPDEASGLLEFQPVPDIVNLLASETPERGAVLLSRLTPGTASRVLQEMKGDDSVGILSRVEPETTAVILSRLDEPVRDGLLSLLPPPTAAEVRQLLSYPPDTAGSLMDPRVTAFRPETRVRFALSRLRASRERRVLDVCVIDEKGRLTGFIPVQDIAIAPVNHRLAMLVRGAPPSVHVTALREEIVETLSQSRLASLPVVDVDNRLLGIIRHDTLVQAIQEEASADIQTMVGASKEERALSSVFFAVRKRLPWLQINLGTAFLAASVVGIFESTIAKFTALAVLLPVVAGQSGNTGAQALAVTMRGLALREIRLRHAARVITKEGLVGLLNGVAVAFVTSFGVWVWSRSVGLCLVIGIAMILSMIIASLSGAVIPMVLTSLRQDPAQSSSIILTTVTDIVGFFSFLGLATLLSAML